MQTITHWSAKRSGACLTVSGRDENGEPTTVTKVRSIERLHADTPAPITMALTRDGTNIVLA